MGNISITGNILKRHEVIFEIKSFLESVGTFDQDNVIINLQKYLKLLIDDISFYFEYPYVENIYRDNFYNYYATKHTSYERDCIRISIFKDVVDSIETFEQFRPK